MSIKVRKVYNCEVLQGFYTYLLVVIYLKLKGLLITSCPITVFAGGLCTALCVAESLVISPAYFQLSTRRPIVWRGMMRMTQRDGDKDVVTMMTMLGDSQLVVQI